MIVRGIVVGDSSPSDVGVENGRIVSISRANSRPAAIGSRDALIGPPLFDIQVNGAFGIDLQSAVLRPENVSELTQRLAAQGVAHWAPTIITNSQSAMERACRTIAEALHNRETARAIPGIHLEGPCISPEDGPRGAHAKAHVRKPSLREFDRLLKAADGKVLYTTVAPEIPGAILFIKGVVKRGVAVSLGHHNASSDQIHRAVDAGATLCTHLGNGIASMIHRHENPLWPQLAEDRLTASVIADLHHLPREVLRAVISAKGPERIILTSDAVHIAGLKPGHYDLGGTPVELKRSGRIRLSGTDLLAGSSLMLYRGVLNAVEHGGMSAQEAFASASSVPAKVLGVSARFARPRGGRKAHFIVIEPRSGNLLAAFVRGESGNSDLL